MNNKNDILESWIMVEHLSEGNINLNDKAILTFSGLWQQDYYAVMLDKMNKSRVGNYKNSGAVIYFDIFPFSEVIDYLRKKYKLKPTEQEITIENKFSFALYFDKERSSPPAGWQGAYQPSLSRSNCANQRPAYIR